MVSLSQVQDALFNNKTLTLIEYDNQDVMFQADAVVTEDFGKQISVGAYPREDKRGQTGDNAQLQSFTLNVSGVTSDATISYIELYNNARSIIDASPFGTARELEDSEYGRADSKSQKAWDILNKWSDNGTRLIVKCKWEKAGFIDDETGAFIPFLIENLSFPRDASVGSAIRYSMTLRMIRLVDLSSVTITNTSILDKGNQQLGSGIQGDDVAGQSTATRTEPRLKQNAYYRNLFDGLPIWGR